MGAPLPSILWSTHRHPFSPKPPNRLGAPLPFILGVHADVLAVALRSGQVLDRVVCVDLDAGTVDMDAAQAPSAHVCLATTTRTAKFKLLSKRGGDFPMQS